MKDLIRKRDIDYISAPIAPVLKGQKVHYEYVAFRKQIEDIPPVPAIPIPEGATNGDVIKAVFPNASRTAENDNYVYIENLDSYIPQKFFSNWWNSPYKRGDTE